MWPSGAQELQVQRYLSSGVWASMPKVLGYTSLGTPNICQEGTFCGSSPTIYVGSFPFPTMAEEAAEWARAPQACAETLTSMGTWEL